MRVISGKFKGRQLVTFKADHIRPTTDRVKESIFNILQQDIPNAKVLDLFSGTGNLAIEAYSREAQKVVAVESNLKSINIIKENLSLLKIKDIEVVKQDAFKYIQTYKGDKFDIVFIDPPFTEALAHSVLQAISKSALFHENTQVLIESAKKEHIEDQYGSLGLIDRRLFGDKILSIYESNHLPR